MTARELRARWALRGLLRRGDRGDQEATDEVWDRWLREPRAELWAALARWRRPRTGGGQSLVALGQQAAASDVIDAARRDDHPIAITARAGILAGQQDLVDAVCADAMADDVLTPFCVEHHLAPADPRRAAVFFLLTGQLEQYRHADPDHSLLAAAYRAASKDEQARIRGRASTEPDLVRVLADTVRRGPLTSQESRYLIDMFAERRDWPALWDLAKDLPVVDAVDAANRVEDWHPRGLDADLFDTLAGALPTALARSHAAIVTPWTVRLSRPEVTVGSFAPGGERIAVAAGDVVEVFTFPRGRPTTVARRPAANLLGVVVFDDGGLVMAGDRFLARGDDGRGFSRAGGAPVVKAFAPAANGAAALVAGQKGRIATLFVLPESGPARIFSVADRLGTGRPKRWTMAGGPASGWIAVAGQGLHLARLTSALDWVADVPFQPGPAPSLAFAGPDRLIGVDAQRVLRMWQLSDGGMSLVATRQLGQVAGSAYPVALPAAGAIAVIDASGATGRRVRCLDAGTLADVPTPARLRDLAPTCLVASPGGTRLAVGGTRYVTVTDVRFPASVVELADRPLSATTPADLETVRARLAASADPAARPFLEVLYACLVHKFAVDVAIGGPGPVAARGDDIALGGSA